CLQNGQSAVVFHISAKLNFSKISPKNTKHFVCTDNHTIILINKREKGDKGRIIAISQHDQYTIRNLLIPLPSFQDFEQQTNLFSTSTNHVQVKIQNRGKKSSSANNQEEKEC
ncbi:hypothetical protein HMI56_007301, partial [Coelomomyces lativittatus]